MELKTDFELSPPSRSASTSPREQLIAMIQGYWVSQICGTAARLGLADQLVDGPRTVSELASLISTDRDGLGRLMRAAATVGLVTDLGGDRFELTPLGAQLRIGDAAGSLGDFAIALSAPGRWLPFGRLFDAVVTGQPQARPALGTDPWAYFASHPEERLHFARAMGGISAEASEAVTRHYDVAGFRRIVDVGGSQGVLLARLLAAAPSAAGVLFDLPEVLDGAHEALVAIGQADRVELVAGNFFEQVPAGGDLYLLKSILHDWDDDRALQILSNIHRACAPGATVAVIEGLLPSHPAPSQVHLANLMMLVAHGGRERTLEDYADLLAHAGFRLERTIPAPSPPFPWTVLEAIRK
jgi:hypothetical protein